MIYINEGIFALSDGRMLEMIMVGGHTDRLGDKPYGGGGDL